MACWASILFWPPPRLARRAVSSICCLTRRVCDDPADGSSAAFLASPEAGENTVDEVAKGCDDNDCLSVSFTEALII